MDRGVLLHRFKFWCQKVLPLVYDDSLSYYEVLCKLTDYINSLIEREDSLEEFLESVRNDIDQLKEEWPEYKEMIQNDMEAFQDAVRDELAGMQEILDDIKNGKYIDLYLDSIKKYIDENLQNLVSGIVKYVVFGLSADGHFVAYIPKAWEFLNFSTITDPDSELYNHLVMTW